MRVLLLSLVLLLPTPSAGQSLLAAVRAEAATLAAQGVPIVNPPPPLTPIQKLARVTRLTGAGFCVADLATTEYLIGTGRYHEGHPLLKHVADKPILMGLLKGGQCLAVHEALRKQARRHPRRAFWIGLVSTVVSGYAVFSNQHKVEEARR